MVEIKLRHGFVVLVDDEDVEAVAGYRWYADHLCNTTYARAQVVTEDGKHTTVLMHRLVMGAGKGELVDHKDRNGLNNQKHNLRLTDKKGNIGNSIGQPYGTSSYKGVTWDKSRNKWMAQIGTGDRNRFLGRFKTEQEAATAYNIAAIEYFGEFAYLNTVNEGQP